MAVRMCRNRSIVASVIAGLLSGVAGQASVGSSVPGHF
jgi:hypothetical protein